MQSCSTATTADGVPLDDALAPAAIRWLTEQRGLSREVIARTRLRSGQQHGERVEADPRGNVIVFPFVENGREVGEKYRGPHKTLWQKKGGRLPFFGLDEARAALKAIPGQPLVITEGEIDMMTALDCGFVAVSVPNGAPPPSDKPVPYDADGLDQETDKGFAYLKDALDLVKKAAFIILAVDHDEPGERLEAELLRRIGRPRCRRPDYPAGCKDLNETLLAHGSGGVAAALDAARDYPLKGLRTFDSYDREPEIQTFSTGWPVLDSYLKLHVAALMVVTGIPNHGKSTWTLQLCAQLARDQGAVCALGSFEMNGRRVKDLLRATFLNRGKHEWSPDQELAADKWIDRHFIAIHHSDHDDGDSLTVNWLCNRITEAVYRYGVSVVLIDPWSDIEQDRGRDETETDYVRRSLKRLVRLAGELELLIILVAHPTKLDGAQGRGAAPSLYNISGSAHWFNRPDFGVVVHRPDFETADTMVLVQKVRYQPEAGQQGTATLTFDAVTRTYRSSQ